MNVLCVGWLPPQHNTHTHTGTGLGSNAFISSSSMAASDRGFPADCHRRGDRGGGRAGAHARARAPARREQDVKRDADMVGVGRLGVERVP